MATSNNDRISSARLLDTLKGLQASRHLGSEPEVDPQTNEKTKHTIKQDYLPNADWSVNDPDADGYVEGRTHWEEVNDISGTINVQSGADTGNFAFGSCDKFGKIKSFSYPNGSFVAEQPSDMIEEEGAQYYFVGEDSNGNAISISSVQDLQTAMQTATIGLILINMNGSTMCYIAYPNVTQGDVCSVELVNEVIHKLPRKFYDYTKPVDYDELDERYKKYNDVDIKDSVQLFKSELTGSSGTSYPSFEIPFNNWSASLPFQPMNGKKYANGGIDYLILLGIYQINDIDGGDLYRYILLNGRLSIVDSETDEEHSLTFDYEQGNDVYMKYGEVSVQFTIYNNRLRWNYTNAPTVLRVRLLPVVKDFNKKFYSTTKYDLLNNFVPEVNSWSSIGPIKVHLGNIIYGYLGSIAVIAKAKLNVWYIKLQSNETIRQEANQWYEICTIPVQSIYFNYKMVDGIRAYPVQQYQITEGNITIDIAIVYGGRKYNGVCASIYVKWSDDLHNLPNSNNKNVEIDVDGMVASNYTYVKITDPLMIAAGATD